MADKVIVTVGLLQGDHIQAALSLAGKLGRVVITSVAPYAANQATLSMFELVMFEKQLVGSAFGSANPRRDIPPRLLRLYQEGQLKLDELVTTTYPLDEVNLGYQAMRNGTNVRGGMILSHGG